MKILIPCLVVSVLPLLGGDFVNLGFVAPDLTGSLRPIDPTRPDGPFSGAANQILRGWTLSLDGQVQTTIAYSPWFASVGHPGVAVRNYRPGTLGVNYLDIDSPSLPLGHQTRIWQVGRIPETVVGIEFSGSALGDVLINGEVVGTTYDGRLRPMDIARYAGQEVTLEFFFRAGSDGSFDILGFTQIPEPSVWALFGIGAATLIWASHRQRQS